MYRRLDYSAPETVDELVSVLREHDAARILAGGTDLLLDLREEVPPDTVVVDIKRCSAQLRGIRETKEGGVWIGSLTTVQDIKNSEVLRERYPALSDAADAFGCLEIRYRATIGGNVAHASPGAEYGTPLFAYEAEAEILGADGRTTMPISDFWKDVGKTALGKEEILSGFFLPPLPSSAKSRYARISRTKGMDLAAMGITILAYDLEHDDLAEDESRRIRIALGAVERVPVRMSAAEEALSGKEITGSLLEKVKKGMADSIHPRATSLRAGPDYKKSMTGVLTERILREFGLYER